MRDYPYYKKMVEGERLPLAYVDMDLLDANIDQVAERARGLPTRIATKSIRCAALLRHVLERNPASYRGLMCFYPQEAAKLAELGFDDLLVAYPYVRPQELLDLVPWIRQGKKIYLMADHGSQLQLLERFAQEQDISLSLCLDIDMSTEHFGIYFGVYRSSVKNLPQAQAFWRELQQCPHLKLRGVMGYEAQIAGVGDAQQGKQAFSAVIRFLKRESIPRLQKRRQEIVQWLRLQGADLAFVNGGGSGSLESTKQDSSVTELTVGSAFYSPTLFDHYQAFHHASAAGFALEVTRKPAPGTFTLAGGGYIASGSIGPEKAPTPYLPLGITLIKSEMCGEVQTPIAFAGKESLQVGYPVFFRHAKAGELCERFNELHLFRGGKIDGKVKTYRGEGWCFV